MHEQRCCNCKTSCFIVFLWLHFHSVLVCGNFNWWFSVRSLEEDAQILMCIAHRTIWILNRFTSPLSAWLGHMANYVGECTVQRVSILCHMVIWAVWVCEMSWVVPVDMSTHPVAEEGLHGCGGWGGTCIMPCGILLLSCLLCSWRAF